MNQQRTIDNIPVEEFEQIVDQFIEQAAAWDGTLPAETSFQAWETPADEEPLFVEAIVVGDELVLETSPESPLTTQGNHIRLEDGRELIIRLRSIESVLQV